MDVTPTSAPGPIQLPDATPVQPRGPILLPDATPAQRVRPLALDWRPQAPALRTPNGLFLRQSLADGFQFLATFGVGFWKAQLQFFQRVDDDLRHDQSRVGLVVGRHDIPG